VVASEWGAPIRITDPARGGPLDGSSSRSSTPAWCAPSRSGPPHPQPPRRSLPDRGSPPPPGGEPRSGGDLQQRGTPDLDIEFASGALGAWKIPILDCTVA